MTLETSVVDVTSTVMASLTELGDSMRTVTEIENELFALIEKRTELRVARNRLSRDEVEYSAIGWELDDIKSHLIELRQELRVADYQAKWGK